VEKVEELARTLDQLQRILSAYPEMMQSKEIQRLELIQRYIRSLLSLLKTCGSLDMVRIFEDATTTVQTQNSKSRFTRFIQGSDDQSKLVDSMGKLTRFVNLLQVCSKHFAFSCVRL